MNSFTNALLFLLIKVIVQEISPSCVEDLKKHKVSESYGFYRDTPQYEVIEESTLRCLNVTSVTNLSLPPFFKHIPQNYSQHMVVEDSNVAILPSGAFLNFSSMETIQLSRIHLRKIEDGAFTNLTVLKKLDLDNNELTELTEELFSSLVELKVLKLGNNRISRVDKFAFVGWKNLSRLYLEGNNISAIKNDTFRDQEDIRYLDLSGNPLGKVPNAVLKFKLKKVYLYDFTTFLFSNINLSHFDVDLSNSSVKTLNLSTNLLETFDFFLIPKVVIEVVLSNNRITSIKNIELMSSKVDLSHNQIKNLTGNFSNLKEIDLSFNNIETIETSIFANATLLKTIYLSHNKVKNFDKNTFSGLSKLSRLDLSHNDLNEIIPGLFKGLSNLKILNLSHNNLKMITFGTFEILNKLRTLDISNNKLIELKSYCFTSMPNLERLKLDNNQITTFDFKYLKSYFSKVRVSLKNNPWTCKQLVEIYQIFKENNVIFLEGSSFDVANYRGVACADEQKVNISFENILQKVIDKSVADLKTALLIDGDFKDSTFSYYVVKEKRILKIKIIQEISWLLEQ